MMNPLAAFLTCALILSACNGRTEKIPADSTRSNDTAMPSHDSDQMESGDRENEMGKMNEMMVEALGSKDSMYEARFIDMMIPHHEGAISMAKHALENANKSELRTMAQKIISGQQREIAQMKQWRAAWFAPDAANGMANSGDMMRHMSMMNDQMVEDMGKKDAEYEHRFIEAMNSHHEAAVAMAEDAIEKANRPELRTLAQEILTAQRTEIETMRDWRKQWYGH